MKSSFWKYQLKYWVPVYIWLIFIFYLSSQPTIPTSSYFATIFSIGPHLQHIFIYAILALFIYRALTHTKTPSKFLVVFSTTFYGFLDEIHQYYVPGRTFDWFDIGMNFLGAILALILIAIFRKRTDR
ncbi:MAG: hypothetical protein CMH63_01240 [Nanoarchaeota archaeon]|jgi:VanZ family protein|nr:hypothetical protein [Nanoarchaeota archaeon]|tara:strand:- start:33156 stop:33539 length:384 start_codon:yes stop_codon:yes gene_type:complete